MSVHASALAANEHARIRSMDAETLYRPSLPVGCRSAASGRMDSSSLSVLVVDSQPSSRREVTGLLRECSYQVGHSPVVQTQGTQSLMW